jgi:Dynein heavy chain region D6 P-loop domain
MIIILGQDVTQELRSLTQELRLKSAEDGLIVVSMGEGQEKDAEFWLQKSAAKGLWIYFQVI